MDHESNIVQEQAATPGEIRGEHGPNVSAAEGDTICDSGNNQVFSSCFVHTGEPCVQFFAHVTQTDTCKLAVFFCRSQLAIRMTISMIYISHRQQPLM